eukprot:scaffold26211_cov176-Cylindrotheca_fusiformis.AAC.1
MTSDYDLIHETVMNLRQARVHAAFTHVKGHQDVSKIPFDELPLMAQLNIEADDLAGAFRRRTSNAVHPLVPLLNHSRCLVHLNSDETLTRAYVSSLRTHAATPALRAYMLKRFRWSLATYHLVDWTLFARSRSRLQASHRQLIKFGFDILPTNVVVARSNPALSEICPL